MSSIIKVSNLTKEFKDVCAVNDLSFSVNQGEVYGFLGQNGAGKSTTIRMLLTLIKPTSGKIEIFGKDLSRNRKEILRNVGAIIERPDLYKYLSALENLRIFSAMSGKKISEKKLMEQLDMVGLSGRANSKVKTYSQGMKQRLGIATALVHDPDLIILDEPTNGLDPQGIADVRNLILYLTRERNKTLLVSSHLLSEMELIADSMLIIDEGKKLVEGNVKTLFDPAETILEFRTTDDDETYKRLLSVPLGKSLRERTNGPLSLRLHRDELSAAMKQLGELGINVTSLNAKHSLEDYFLSLTKHGNVPAS
jgi:ABC-type multidrug transport system ATPase subunit